MPQASDELRNIMQQRFGDAVSDEGPLNFLYERGWTDKAGMFHNPRYTNINAIPDDEWQCIAFMCDEWDYGIDGGFNK